MTLRNKYLGQVILSVGKYKNRLRGDLRGHDSTGVRLDCHHAPHDGTTTIARHEGTAVAIPEDIHTWLHRVRNGWADMENPKEMVDNDFKAIWAKLKERGCTDDHIEEALQLVHESNRSVSYTDPYTGVKKTINLYHGKHRVMK